MLKTTHFQKMLSERNIHDEWVDRTLANPDKIEDHEDGTKHYLKQIHEYENRWLRVIVSSEAAQTRAVTVFFDRRLRRTP
jgi:hypothetical protein